MQVSIRGLSLHKEQRASSQLSWGDGRLQLPVASFSPGNAELKPASTVTPADSLQPGVHVFGLQGEAGVSGGNPDRHRENTQTPRRIEPSTFSILFTL